MCTLTAFVDSQHQLVVTMNRDEAFNRGDGEFHHSTNSEPFDYPTDERAGGTWFGVNKNGLVLGLLNRYQDTYNAGDLSRGFLIPQLLGEAADAKEASQVLKQLELKRFNPFDLIAVAGSEIVHHAWTGSQLLLKQHTLQRPYIRTSSAIDLPAVSAFRQQLFDDWLSSAEVTAHNALNFHRHEDTTNLSYSICMDRGFSQTKSITQAVVDSAQSTYQVNYVAPQELRPVS